MIKFYGNEVDSQQVFNIFFFEVKWLQFNKKPIIK